MTPEQLLPNQKQPTMKSAEELIKQKYPFYDSNIETKDVELNGRQVIELMELHAAQDRWVKVSDRMPNIGSTVLVYPVRESFRNNQIGYSIVYNSDNKPKFEYTGITHWMELPTAPKD